MMRLGIANLKEHIKSIGLYNNKAKNIIALSEILVSNFNGEIPQDRGSLEKPKELVVKQPMLFLMFYSNKIPLQLIPIFLEFVIEQI